MIYLLDTNILSEAAPTKARPQEALIAWIGRNENTLYLSTITLLEISYGIERLEARGARAKAARLREWASLALHGYRDRIIPVSNTIAVLAGRLIALAEARGGRVSQEDAIIAASAENIGATVLTRNTRHFQPMGVAQIDPFIRLPQ